MADRDVDDDRQLDDCIAAVLGRLSERVSAKGRRDDELPVRAFDDAVAQFPARPHRVIGLRAPQSEARLRHNLVDRLLDQFRLPIAVFL